MNNYLILPLSVLQKPPPPSIAKQYLTLSGVTGELSTFADLMKLLGTIRRSDVVLWTSTLIEVVGKNDGCRPPMQSALIRDLLEKDLGDRVLAKARAESDVVVFHRRQLWLLLQLASIASNESTEPGDAATVRHTVGRACLMASDCLAKIQDVHELASDAPKNGLQWLITVMLSHVDTTSTNQILARAKSFWFESLSDPKVRKELELLEIGDNFDAVVLAKVGITLKEFFFIAVSLYFVFLEPTLKEKVSPALIDVAIPSGGLFSDDDKKRVLNAMSINIADMPAFLFGTPRQSWATDFSPLQAHPLLEVFPGRYTCPDLSFYRQFFIEGFFTMIEAAVGKDCGNLYAAIFEWYINILIGSFTVTSTSLFTTFFPDIKFQGTQRRIDGLLFWGETAVICEYKGTRLPIRAKSDITINSTISAIIERMSGSEKCGVGQLATSIAMALDGKKLASGTKTLDLRECKRIIPVLIWHEELAVNHAVRNHLQDLFSGFLKQATDADQSCVGPLLLLSVRDIELLEHLANQEGGMKVICEYADFVHHYPRDPLGTFYAYAYQKFQPRQVGLVADNLKSLLESLEREHLTRRESD